MFSFLSQFFKFLNFDQCPPVSDENLICSETDLS